MSSIEEAQSEDLGIDLSITTAEVNEVVKKLPGSKVPRVVEICPYMLKAVDMLGLYFNVAWRSGTMSME